MKRFFTAAFVSVLSTTAFAQAEQNYCVGVRGNGQLMPAHWGALAQTMETYGAPEALAGGSSGSITTFLWESATLNPHVSKDKAEAGRQLALMFKSLEGVTRYLYEKPEWKSLAEWIGAVRSPGGLANLRLGERLSTAPDLVKAIESLRQSRIFFGPAVRTLLATAKDRENATSPEKRALAQKRIAAFKDTVSVFGKFDAKDKQLFVREGVIDFEALAKAFGALGDFLSLRSAPAEADAAMKSLLTTCLPHSVGKTWPEIVQAKPSCREDLNTALDSYFAKYKPSRNSRILERVGQHRPALISTSIVRGESAVKFREMRKAYLDTLEPSPGVQIAEKDLKFGYWGRPQDLAKIKFQFDSGRDPLASLDKSQRFLGLGQATWLQVLSLSPAEPGLSAAIDLSAVGLEQDLVSFGGWSDLHPAPVLKARGCDKVVYLQRRGGESFFGIGIAKQILGFEQPSWELLDGKSEASVKLNNDGSADDMASTWAKLYNLRNPKSSYAASVQASDAVVCTDWNSFEPEKEFSKMIAEAYRAPIYQAGSMVALEGAPSKFVAADAGQVDPAKGFSPYAGCIPLK